MSTKTIYKRIALVAVAALGAGVLSVAPANATITSLATADAQLNANVCSVTDGSTTTDTAVTTVGGVIKLTAGGSGYVDFTGPGEFVMTDTNGGVTFASGQAVLAGADNIGIKATAVGTIKVSLRDSSTGGAAFAAVITVVASCVNGVVSASKSYSRIVAVGNAAASALGDFTTNVDEANVSVIAEDGKGYIRAQLNDAYGAKLPNTGVVQVTATGDVVIGVSQDNDANSAGVRDSVTATTVTTTNTWISSGSGYDLSIIVGQKSGAPTTSVVTVAYNGTVVASKTLVFLGAPAKVVVSDVTVGERVTAGTGKGYFRYTVTDALGNPLGSKVAVTDSTFNAGAIAVVSALAFGDGGGVTSATTGKTPAVTATNIGLDDVANFTCTAKGGTASLQVKVAVDSASTEFVTSAPFTVACGGAIDTWSISLDKATYAPGEIATLTVAAKDALGFPVFSLEDIEGIAYSFGGMTAVTAPTNGDLFSSAAGAKTYQFSVGTTEGAFVGTFKITGATDTAAKTIQYKIAGSAGVSNADVLKAIVSLIASINKQIAALQKALLRR
jgi:trimeric autotransporter adhesin